MNKKELLKHVGCVEQIGGIRDFTINDGKAKGNLLIYNEPMNRYPQIIQIFRDDTGELIYQSGAIPVGARLDEAKLDVNLKAGIYNCTAHFNQIDENGNMLGKACAKIIVYVLE